MKLFLVILLISLSNYSFAQSFHFHGGLIGGRFVHDGDVAPGSVATRSVVGGFVGGSYQKRVMEYGGEVGLKYRSTKYSDAYDPSISKNYDGLEGMTLYVSPFVNIDPWYNSTTRLFFGARAIKVERIILPLIGAGIRMNIKKLTVSGILSGTYIAGRSGGIVNISVRR